MFKKIFFIFLIVLVLLGYIFNIDKDISHKITNISFSIRSVYNKYLNSTIDTFNSYYNQQKNIILLENRISKNNNFEILYNIVNDELLKLKKELSDKNITISVKYVDVLSYINLNNFSKVILDINLINDKKIYPLVTNKSYSAGIALTQNNQTVSYLNTNPKCNYAVFIGLNNAPGITSGVNKKGEIIIKYIPKWYNIQVGDSVSTSGMDNIFPSGIKVGIVTSINELVNTKNVTLKPYAKVLSQKSFYIIEKY